MSTMVLEYLGTVVLESKVLPTGHILLLEIHFEKMIRIVIGV